MPALFPNRQNSDEPAFLPWVHFSSALLVMAFTALNAAIHSPLGNDISAGESSGFEWLRVHHNIIIGFGLVYLIGMCWIQIKQFQAFFSITKRLLSICIGIELLSVAVIGLLLFVPQTRFLSWAFSIILATVLVQMLLTSPLYRRSQSNPQLEVFQKPILNAGLFLSLLFCLGAAIAVIEPSWHRLTEQIALDSNFEKVLRFVFPPILSGMTHVWFGIGLMIILTIFSPLIGRSFEQRGRCEMLFFLMCYAVMALLLGLILFTLYCAVSWEIVNLRLTQCLWQLFFTGSVAGGIFISNVFLKLVAHLAEPQHKRLIGLLAVGLVGTIFSPAVRLFNRPQFSKRGWVLFLLGTLSVCMMISALILFGNLFNPWFTATSYLKGALLKVLAVIVAGIMVLLFEEVLPVLKGSSGNIWRQGMILTAIGLLGFLPFYALGKYPEVKVAVLQFNELTRVDTTFAREFVNVLHLDRWIHLGQRPKYNGNPHPWPEPWHLKKTHASLLPANFNLLILVVDALRGDAFHSAGYHRRLTPFLDHWTQAEGVSFRRAYTQGGGSFAAFPFMVAGRSRFELYGPDLHRRNLYFKVAQAEGIQHYMLMKDFGPRLIFPPGLAVTELAIPRAVSDRRSATADEVFAAAREAIGSLQSNERFLCFLHLMDVHNDLWKKDDGVDFGDTPRDVYDNNLSYLDRAFERFVGWLKESRVYERTVILFLSDHGEQFWEHGASLHGHTLYEEEIRIPLILVTHRFKQRFEEVPVIAADMAPTIADLAGYSVTPPYDDAHMGISLVPLLMGEALERYRVRDVAGRASFKRRYLLYRNWKWKLIYFAELDLLQLFSVVNDPMERNNLLNERPALAARLEKELSDYLGKIEGRSYRRRLSNVVGDKRP